MRMIISLKWENGKRKIFPIGSVKAGHWVGVIFFIWIFILANTIVVEIQGKMLEIFQDVEGNQWENRD